MGARWPAGGAGHSASSTVTSKEERVARCCGEKLNAYRYPECTHARVNGGKDARMEREVSARATRGATPPVARAESSLCACQAELLIAGFWQERVDGTSKACGSGVRNEEMLSGAR